MLMSIPQCTILEIQDTLKPMVAYDFDWVILEIPVKYCIVGMLSTCTIQINWTQIRKNMFLKYN